VSQEGGLKAPKRQPIPFEDPLYYDEEDFEKELRRVADICHGCRRCFNLCSSFPKLFDAIDNSETGEVDGLSRHDFQPVIDACTLCDMCFMVKCPYVTPHPFNLDFPKLMLRARAIKARKKEIAWVKRQLSQTDRNGKIGCAVSGIANWATKTSNTLTRQGLEKIAGIHAQAKLPVFENQIFSKRTKPQEPNPRAPGFGEKVVLYATCFIDYHQSSIGRAALSVLALNGVEVKILYPECCGMPLFEQGELESVNHKAKRLSKTLSAWVEKGFKIITLVPSCTLMLTHEWPLLRPHDERVKTVADHTYDISGYMVWLHHHKGWVKGLQPIRQGIFLHIACHARAQNKGRQAEYMLKHLPETPIETIEKCSGHGGSWGVMKENFPTALEVGKPVMVKINKSQAPYVVSECPLACDHLAQGSKMLCENGGVCFQSVTPPLQKKKFVKSDKAFKHPIEMLALSWRL